MDDTIITPNNPGFIVDPSAMFLDFAITELSALGYCIIPLRDGTSILRHPQLPDASFVLTDMLLPDMTAIELMQQLRARLPDIRIIFMGVDLELMPLAQELGVRFILKKSLSSRSSWKALLSKA